MTRYAKETTVAVEKTRAEIEKTLIRYHATEFVSGWKPGGAMIAFKIGSLFVRFVLPLPGKGEKRFTHKADRYGFDRELSATQAAKTWEQEVRSRWRGLLLNIKGKLEAVELGISTKEEEFLAHIVLPDDRSMGEWLIGEALPQIVAGNVPQIGYRRPDGGQTQDAEFTVKNESAARNEP